MGLPSLPTKELVAIRDELSGLRGLLVELVGIQQAMLADVDSLTVTAEAHIAGR